MSMPRPTDKPSGITEGESRVIAAFVHQLRDVHPQAREAQKAANARTDAIDSRSKQNEVDLDRIDRERATRIAASHARFETLDQRTLPIDGMLKAIGRLGAANRTRRNC